MAFEPSTIVALPLPRAQIPVATSVRSTLLMSSQRTLRERGYFERYAALLAPERRDAVLAMGAPSWLPIEVAIAHYEACEQLGVPASEIQSNGALVAEHAQGSWLGTVAVRFATGAGATPWTVLAQGQRMWERAWVGSAVACVAHGPKDAVIEVVGWPCARIPYCRIAFRGILLGLVQLFAKRAYVRDVPEMCGTTTVGYRAAWV